MLFQTRIIFPWSQGSIGLLSLKTPTFSSASPLLWVSDFPVHFHSSGEWNWLNPLLLLIFKRESERENSIYGPGTSDGSRKSLCLCFAICSTWQLCRVIFQKAARTLANKGFAHLEARTELKAGYPCFSVGNKSISYANAKYCGFLLNPSFCLCFVVRVHSGSTTERVFPDTLPFLRSLHLSLCFCCPDLVLVHTSKHFSAPPPSPQSPLATSAGRTTGEALISPVSYHIPFICWRF